MADPKEVHVKVFLHPTSNPKFHFETSDLPLGPDNSLTFENHGHPGFYVHYDLQEPIHGHLFPGDTIDDHLDEALFSKAQSSCPSTKGQWGQFKAKEVTNQGKTLIVHNQNQSKVQFGYTLRVTDDHGTTYLPLDPGGLNQNGPRLAVKASIAIAAAVGAAVGSLVTIGVQAALSG